jgi:hypothetical protein
LKRNGVRVVSEQKSWKPTDLDGLTKTMSKVFITVSRMVGISLNVIK